ncbi:dephospho-CoA kinase [Bacillaceae bacterium ZC4]|jgi:dephospho-CoA kinase|uniref:Dephospho-CoA kinase n=1 Tax=Aeribacillus pallidus TaxID=33936 RepID=A0A165YJT5_9BACI|nr:MULTISPECIES: dephospho-CoA kinase [Aeribacillus]AXI40312.1 dephospho-CoA kinase [Bacillaceae bacterium ZC4]AXI40369.1 dephospho-CoA kinase [Bacillaceae bacterium ZC4]KZN97155.1 dephospho-CoA kinase [Aeribacillus pallidus]MED0703364.1 dephospho-CoA kinase [Aeribacillus composti]TVZ81707.1 dephospho-CoA kinase [Aeribacillus composti]
MTMIIGLTGGIASGKSTVSEMLKKRGIPVIDADLIAREVVEVGKKAYTEIVNAFGKEILNEDLTINRARLGSIVFQNEDKREKLNSIVHPEVRLEMKRRQEQLISEGAKAVVLDIPLLFESNLKHLVDKVIVVYTGEKNQLERLMKRNNFSKKEALSRINAQMPLKEKVKFADAVINNDGTLEETEQQLENILMNWGIG